MAVMAFYRVKSWFSQYKGKRIRHGSERVSDYKNFDGSDIGGMLRELYPVVQYNNYDKAFHASLDDHLRKTGKLSGYQVDRLKSMFARYFDRLPGTSLIIKR